MNQKIAIILSFFIIFITACEEEQQYPLANYKLASTNGTSGFMNILDASSSISFIGNKTLMYRWDLNGDHNIEWDTDWLNTPICYFIFNEGSEAIIGLQVKDELNQITEFYSVKYYNRGVSNYNINDNIASKYHQSAINYYNIHQTWLRSNLYSEDSIGIFNPDLITPITTGSYYNWEIATNKYKIREEKELLSSDELWEIPSLEQWKVLINYYGGELVAGYNLNLDLEKSINLPYSGYFVNEVLTDFEQAGYYWTSTKFDENNAYAIKITPDKYNIEIVTLPIDVAASVRLIIQYQNN